MRLCTRSHDDEPRIRQLMADRSESRRHTVGFLIALVCAVAATVPMMLWIAFHNFALFDDEGYYLLSLAALAQHHPLYTQVYGTYGPAYYELLLAAFWLFHLPFTPDATRLVTVIGWATASLLSGIALWRACRSIALSVAAVLICFVWLQPLGSGGELYATLLIVPLQLLLVIALPAAIERRSVPWLVGCGIVVGTILLIKVNIGVFTLAALGVTIGAVFPETRFPRWLWWSTCAIALAIAPILMVALIRDPWVEKYLIGSEAALVALLIAARLSWRSETSSQRTRLVLLSLGAGGLAACLGLFAAVVHAGTVAAVALHSTFIAPLNQTHDLVLPVPVGFEGVGLMILIALGTSLLIWRCHDRQGTEKWDKRYLLTLALTKLIGGGWIILWGINGNSSLGPAFDAAWMGLAGFSNQAHPLGSARRGLIWLIAAFGVFQQLQMYPVAGVQVASGTLWFMLAGLIMIDDGLRTLTALVPKSWRFGLVARLGWADVVRVGGAALVAATIASQVQVTLAASPTDTISLGLRGSSWMELPRPEVDGFRNLTHYLERNCSTFISAPGFDTLYTWTHEPPPLGLLVDDWMYGVSAAEQRTVVQKLQNQPRVCGVINRRILHFWQDGRPLPPSPVLDYLAHDYVRVREFEGFEVLLRK